MLLFADAGDSFVDYVLEFVGWNVSKGFAGLVDGLIEQTPFDGVFDEFGEGALL